MTAYAETIQLGSQSFSVTINSKYDLTSEAMQLRGQRPLFVGDTYVFTFTLTSAAGVAVDLTAATITFTAKYRYQDLDADKIVQKTGVIVAPATNGVFTVTIAKGDVSSYNLVRGYYDIQIEQSGQVTTVLYGEIEWLQDVTKTVLP